MNIKRNMMLQLPWVYVIQIVLLLSSVLFAITTNGSLKALCVFSLINSIAVTLLVALCQRKVFTIYLLFMVFLAIFHFGQAWLYIFQIPVDTSISYDIFKIYPEQQIYAILSFCLIIYNVMNLFAIRNLSKHSLSQKIDNNLSVLFNDRNEVLLLGRVLFAFLIIPVMIYDVQIIMISTTYGHIGLYTHANSLTTWAAANSYFPLAIILLMLGSDPKKNGWKAIYCYAILRCLLLMVITGKRGSLIIPLLLYVFCKHSFIKRYKRKDIVWLAIGAFLLLTLISFVAYGRGDYNGLDFGEFLLKENIIAQTLSEFGSTFTTTMLAYRYTLSNEFLFGKSYLGALSVFAPFSDYFFVGIKKYMSLETLLNPFSPSGGALGGSLLGEMFINFGWYAVLLAPMMGILIGKMSQFVQNTNGKILHKCLAVYLSYGIWIFVRGNFVDVVFITKRIIYIYILCLVLRYVFHKWKSGSRV